MDMIFPCWSEMSILLTVLNRLRDNIVSSLPRRWVGITLGSNTTSSIRVHGCLPPNRSGTPNVLCMSIDVMSQGRNAVAANLGKSGVHDVRRFDSPGSRLGSQDGLRKLTIYARWPASRQACALCRAAALARTSDVARQANFRALLHQHTDMISGTNSVYHGTAEPSYLIDARLGSRKRNFPLMTT